jgi:hypothetical protein
MATNKLQKPVKVTKKGFSKFSHKEAYEYLKVEHLVSWNIEFDTIKPSEIFEKCLERITIFDLQGSEEGKKLIIDAILVEALQSFRQKLKVWKGVNLEGDIAHGEADYLITVNKGYLETPFLCIIEAKRDDFYQGLAQCLVEMKTCQWKHQQESRNIDILGIVTNGEGWKYYKLDKQNIAFETILYSDIPMILGGLHYLFQQCEKNIAAFNHITTPPQIESQGASP